MQEKKRHTKKQLVEHICDYSGASFLEVYNKTDPDKRDYVVSSQKLYSLGYVPIFDLEKGVQEILDFLQYLSPDSEIRQRQTLYMFNYS